jgi:pimeloyl-ACP methyl ester carboxylesterase
MKPTTVVMVHGAGGGGWEYDLWKPVFVKAGWKVIAPDLLPHKDGLAKTTFDHYLAQVTAWCPKSGTFVLVGASMGGILALKATETVKPSALVLVNSVAPLELTTERTTPPYPEIVRWANAPLQETRDALFDSDEKTIRWAWKRWRDESGTVLNTLRQGIAVAKPTRPVLTVLSEKDTDIPYTTGLKIAEWANADVHLYRGMSHVGPLMSKRYREVAQATLTWLSSR